VKGAVKTTNRVVASRTPSQAPVALLALAAAAFVLAVWAYWPALSGEFVFDDLHLPFMQPGAAGIPLAQWLGLRPLVMFTYWANLHISGPDPFLFHSVNLIFHFAATVLFFFVAKKILELAKFLEPHRTSVAALCAAVFLLHPMQTEAVSYVAQRGESMGAMFFFAAWCVFLYRPHVEISWPTAAGVLALYGAAVATKEHTISLPAVLLLTDYFFHPESAGWVGIKRNWRLYLPIAAGGLIGSLAVARYISRDTTSIGFQLKEFTWYQYLFTEWRVFFLYLAEFILPIWQTVDHDFSISHSPVEHGALFALLGILALVALAIAGRKKYPLASFGFLLFAIMLLPTSSVIPIKDVAADRRFYLPMTGLLFVCAELLRQFRHTMALTAVLLVVLAGSTWSRNQVWASSLNLWEDAAEKSPGKQRVQFGLAVATFRAGRCHEAVEHYRKAAEIEKPDYTLLMNWALAYECDHQPDQAIATLRESLRQKPSAQAWASMGVLYARQGKVTEALDALMKGQVLDPTYTITYYYRARIYQAMDRIPDAIQNLNVVLGVDPGNVAARQMMDQLKGQAR
jgi:tetratricopeptide (TPR) repeat protein